MESMTVRDLKKFIEDLPDDTPVTVTSPVNGIVRECTSLQTYTAEPSALKYYWMITDDVVLPRRKVILSIN
jgi:hypothetical protein